MRRRDFLGALSAPLVIGGAVVAGAQAQPAALPSPPKLKGRSAGVRPSRTAAATPLASVSAAST